jgi:ABC-type sugar transport system ATPase subunit
VTVLRDGESVGTHPAGRIDEAGLIRLMVGREVAQIYPPAESPPSETVLELRHVGCRASGVSDVSFAVRAGEVFGLAGLVGAGRTELARVLFGLTPADAGKSGSTASVWSCGPRRRPWRTGSPTCPRTAAGTASCSTCRSRTTSRWRSTAGFFRPRG